MTTTSWRRRLATAGLIGAVALGSVQCGDVARTGKSPAYVIIDRIEAAPGDTPESFGGQLNSDVMPVFNDPGRATFRLALKNPGTPTAPLGPSTLNEVTLTRYRVRYIRADGRNTPGVHVPYAFDGGMTVTVPANGTAQGVFDVVRQQAKLEPPLSNLVGFGGSQLIFTIAEVTFYGRDQAGNDVVATGQISVNFADFADDES